MRYLAIAITSLLFSASALAGHHQVIQNYVSDLGRANYKHITSLFTKNGYVISTSRGKVNAKEFFYSFLPDIVSAHTEIKEIYDDAQYGESATHHAVRFRFTYQLKGGERSSGEYVDVFVFDKNKNKLSALYMYENTHL